VKNIFLTTNLKSKASNDQSEKSCVLDQLSKFQLDLSEKRDFTETVH